MGGIDHYIELEMENWRCSTNIPSIFCKNLLTWRTWTVLLCFYYIWTPDNVWRIGSGHCPELLFHTEERRHCPHQIFAFSFGGIGASDKLTQKVPFGNHSVLFIMHQRYLHETMHYVYNPGFLKKRGTTPRSMVNIVHALWCCTKQMKWKEKSPWLLWILWTITRTQY